MTSVSVFKRSFGSQPISCPLLNTLVRWEPLWDNVVVAHIYQVASTQVVEAIATNLVVNVFPGAIIVHKNVVGKHTGTAREVFRVLKAASARFAHLCHRNGQAVKII